MMVFGSADLFELPIDNSGRSKWVLIISIGDNPPVRKDHERNILSESLTVIISLTTIRLIISCGWTMVGTTMQGSPGRIYLSKTDGA